MGFLGLLRLIVRPTLGGAISGSSGRGSRVL